jgi:predicted nucleic acid-binding protein
VKTYVLDASALMTFFEGRPGAEKVEELLATSAETKRPLLMSVVNWGEAYYSVSCARGEKAAGEKLKQIAQLPIDIVGVDMELAKVAATLKAEHNLPYADCFAAALTRLKKAMLVTADRDFEIVKEILRIVWAS